MSAAAVLESVELDYDAKVYNGADWLWHGYLARGSITLLTSLWKAGKTTLLSVLLSKMRTGGMFVNRMLKPCRAAIVTEEPAELWRERDANLNLRANVRFYFQPFDSLPSLEQWHGLMASLLRDRERHGTDLAVIDTLGTFLPAGAESLRDGMMRALLPLQSLKSAGMSVLLLHHPRKRNAESGMAARGSGALTGYADIVLELRSLGRPESTDRRRSIISLSRHACGPRELIIELNAEGNEYLSRGTTSDEECRHFWPVLAAILDKTDEKLTRNQILERWPTPDPPSPATLWRWLDWGVEQEQLKRDSAGNGHNTFRYWLADREVVIGYPELRPLEAVLPEHLRRRG